MAYKSTKFRDTPEGKTTLTPEMDDFIKANYLTVPMKRMAVIFGKTTCLPVRTRMRQLGLVVPADILAERKKSNCFKPGTIPPNKGKKWSEYLPIETQERCRKTTFKKGSVPPNKQKVGSISIRTYGVHEGQREYKIKMIKTGEGGHDWLPLHVYNWINAGNEIRKGYVISFKDGDSLNPVIENLELISMKENMLRNSIQNYPEDLKEIMLIKGRIKRQITKFSKQKP